MPRPALTEEQRRETRRSIRAAAARIYAKEGLAGVSARSVADLAGVSVGTLYSYFANLGELMQSLWKEPVSHFQEELAAVAERNPEPQKRLRRLLEAYVKFATEQRAVYRGAFLFVRPESLEQPVPVELKDEKMFALISQAITDGQRAGVFRAGSARKMTQTLWAGLHGAIALPTNIDRLAFDPPERIARQMIDALLEWIEA